MDLLCAYDWPGNVRELENAIERAATLCEGDVIQAADLPPSLVAVVKTSRPSLESEAEAPLPQVPDSALFPLRDLAQNAPADASPPNEPLRPLKIFLREQEQAHLNRALERCGGDKERAALLLGISLATFYRKMAGED